MKDKFKKYIDRLYKLPILYSLGISIILMLLFATYIFIADGSGTIKEMPQGIFFGALILGFFVYPGILTLLNIVFLFMRTNDKRIKLAGKKIDVVTIILGTVFTGLYMSLMDIRFVPWDTVLKNNEKHFMLSIEYLPGFIIPVVMALGAYIYLRIKSIKETPPLFAVICISSLYLGIGICVMWILQVFGTVTSDPLLALAPFNFVLILIKVIKEVIIEWNDQEKMEEPLDKSEVEVMENPNTWKGKVNALLKNSLNWPLIAFIFTLPLLGIVIMISIIIGQRPDSFYRVWTETADWNLSQKIAPPNEMFDQHYLCTVAVAGHPRLVKPLRPGTRGGETILVNRQLCIANAFEQLLEEKLPKFHKAIRDFYDKYGYPISRHINSPWRADTVYLLMKPLEWLFLVVLYLFDIEPERRISRQYAYKPVR
ncbi:DUF6688 domain-containing protein [Microaceticoccus formicicus]|uniref:DUF6688 domain-containing protein n=1 Tax=Microaceticoccus formicicus TaxID=3118105 RepID=UPI003CD0196F|nr:DUF6688 family protein [Peptoniphilaceae bacterium AMB_02]